jgi:hypothetical protein
MDILINELSLTGQYASTEQFIKDALLPFSGILKEISPDINTIHKKQDLWNYHVTSANTLHDILILRRDEVRRLKLLMSCLLNEPYWDENQKHAATCEYTYNNKNICGQSIAEACERDKIVISFLHPDFSSLQLSVLKNKTTIAVDNLFNEGHFIAVAKRQGIIAPFSLKDKTRFTKTSYIEQGKTIYIENSTDYYWYLDNFHRTHYEIFDAKGIHIGIADLNGYVNTKKRDTSKRINL